MTADLTGDDSENCLCLVASYSKRAELIAKVTAETEQRVSLSPVLGDFLALRYLNLGPEPGQVGDWQRPVRTVAAELHAAAGAAGRNHFALIVIDKSATTIEQLLASCGAEPFLAGFRMRLAGIASNDDRTDSCHADIVASPNGAWSDPADLAAALRRQCEDLLRYFAARREPGLTPVELDTLKRAYAPGDDDDTANPADDQETGPTDLLDPANPATWSPLSDAPASSGHLPVPPPPSIPSAPGQPATPAGLLDAISRLLPSAPRRRGRQSPPSTPLAATTPPGRLGLVYFLTLTEPGMGEGLGQDRLQAVLRNVDKRLAAQPNCAYQVKLLYGTDDKLRGDRQQAGLLNRRIARRSVEVTHFDEVVKSVHAALRRDLAEVGTTATGIGVPVARSAVILLTTDPPIADRRSVGAFGELAAEATIIWLVPRNTEGLVNQVFGDRGPAAVLGESELGRGPRLRNSPHRRAACSAQPIRSGAGTFPALHGELMVSSTCCPHAATVCRVAAAAANIPRWEGISWNFRSASPTCAAPGTLKK